MRKDESLANLLAAHYALLRERLQYFIDTLPLPLRDDVFHVFKEPGKLFSLQDDQSSSMLPGRWALITLLVAQGISPTIDLRLAGDVAIAVEIFMYGVDLVDDIEDGDQSAIIQAFGTARVLNIATTLFVLAQKVLLSLSAENIDHELIISLLNVLMSSSLKALNGQHLDILSEKTKYSEASDEKLLEIVNLKTGCLMSVIMELGALCTGVEKEICNKFAEFGRLLGIYHQIDNDNQDLGDLMHNVEDSTTESSSQRPIKTDLIREKKTFPIVIASRQGDGDREKAIHEGILASWGVSLLYRERAFECLQDLEERNLVSPLLRFVLY